jgi:hypothetical protein
MSIVIENRRWDPITGTTSAALSVYMNMTSAALSIVVKPIKAYQQASTARSADSENSEVNRIEIAPQSGGVASSIQTPSTSSRDRQTRGCMRPLGAAAAASATGVGDFFAYYTKGFMVDLPLAATEGLRAVPKLYGQEVRDFGPVNNWKRGVEVAGKNLAHGMMEGFIDVGMEPIKGGREEGALGVVKGLGKGLANLTTKTSSGMPLLVLVITGAHHSN